METEIKPVKKTFGQYEHKSEPLASRKVFAKRVYTNLRLAVVFLSGCLLMGVLGYKYLGPMEWIDALHNASMILSGMGPVVTIETTAGKLFSSFYALFLSLIHI